MALVKILASNLFAGANFQKLEVGKVYDADSAIAEKWVEQGKAETSKEKGGEKLSFEVATPSAPVSTDTSALQSKLDDALEQLKVAQDAAEAKEKEHADALEAANKRADDAEAALAAATKKDK
ncbi:hypothetical protein HA48_14530 [Pantoea wallisii]|uniref:Uncharacterized protein n=1 Tax=Pantoea wallisii TaxID=1076551 RepID=A0A1X1D783_9GAMM|nr:hypothetical protein [Pantoea wallisii]ORM72371.1 hypothetical protein HA48_14530 [Pantoea wallisii]